MFDVRQPGPASAGHDIRNTATKRLVIFPSYHTLSLAWLPVIAYLYLGRIHTVLHGRLWELGKLLGRRGCVWAWPASLRGLCHVCKPASYGQPRPRALNVFSGRNAAILAWPPLDQCLCLLFPAKTGGFGANEPMGARFRILHLDQNGVPRAGPSTNAQTTSASKPLGQSAGRPTPIPPSPELLTPPRLPLLDHLANPQLQPESWESQTVPPWPPWALLGRRGPQRPRLQ